MRRVEVEMVVRVTHEGVGQVVACASPDFRPPLVEVPGSVRVIAGVTVLRRRMMLPPCLAIGMTLENSGEDDSAAWEGFRIDALRMDVCTSLVTATMNVAAQTPDAVAVVRREWMDRGWLCR